MSRSPEDEKDGHNAERNQVNRLLNRMMLEGRSFSGHERNCCYLNCGSSPAANGRFANISATSGIDFPDDGRALVTMDWDQDGDLDIWVANRNAPRLRFMRNQLAEPHRYLSFQLEGNGTTVNRDAIGARVEVVLEKETDNQKITKPNKRVQTLRAGEGFLSQNSKRLHFGIGENEQVRRVVVAWPDGQREDFGPLEDGAQYRLVQGSGQAERKAPRTETVRLAAMNQTLPPKQQQSALHLLTPLPLPLLSYETFSGKTKQLRTKKNKALLINLWASWCQPCLEELLAFSTQAERLQEAGLEIVALNVDGLGNDTTPPETASKWIANQQLPFTVGRANSTLLDQLQQLHDMQTTLRPPLPLPTSFLIDATGELITIYKGPVTVEEVLKELKNAAATTDRKSRLRRIAGMPGETIQDTWADDALETIEVERRFQYADWLRENGFEEPAIVQYQIILRLWPDSAKAHIDLGSSWLGTGNLDGAEQAFKQALAIEPDSSRAHLRLGSLYLKKGQQQLALRHLQQAEKLSPEDVSILNNLGTLYDQLGNYQQAIEQFNRAIELVPGEPGSYNNLAWLRATCADAKFRDGPQAVKLAREACHLTGWNNFSTLDTLATAYAATGNLEEALRWQMKAIEYAPKAQQDKLKRRLEVYRKDKTSLPPRSE